MDDLLTLTIHHCAADERRGGSVCRPHTEQYTWILKLLKTRKPGEIEPYKRKELFPKK
jgi:lauroyl-KDO2-lipid IV(A) myristoyltransferase